MTGRRDNPWAVFAVGGLLATAAMSWVTYSVTSLERAECRARAIARDDERARLAVWRMDAFLNALIAPEAARPLADYDTFRNESTAFDQGYQTVEPGIRTLSPLIAFRSELLTLHFQVSADGRFTSPQIPTGEAERVCNARFPGLDDREILETRMRRLRDMVPASRLGPMIREASVSVVNCVVDQGDDPAVDLTDVQTRVTQSVVSRNPVHQNVGWTAISPSITEVGTMLPMWFGEGNDAELVFVRRVVSGGATLFQGLVVDTSALHTALLRIAADLYPDDHDRLDLVRHTSDATDPDLRTLATAPLRLATPPPEWELPMWTPVRSVLATAWAALLLTVLSIGFTLRRALDLGARRARFASAVTHELRSPLTTFRMYAEMLDEGMVDGQRRAEYIATLRSESDRLASLVENVLAYARLEEGRHGPARSPVRLDALVESAAEVLRRRAAAAGLELTIDVDNDDTVLETDREAVVQILFGLVDNACKHASNATCKRIELGAKTVDDVVELRVRDHGGGIPNDKRTRLFEAFERGSEVGDVPGLGLGLAIARGLATALGGRLELDSSIDDGAAFVLRLPRA